MANRFEMLELDDTPIVAPPAPKVFDAGEVDLNRKAALDADRAALVKAGYAQEGEFYEAGTVMAASGQDVKRKKREEIQALPPAREVAAKFADEIRAEKRLNIKDLDLGTLKVNKGGDLISLLTPQGTLIGKPSATAWGHIGQLLDTPGLATFLPNCNGEIRRDVILSHLNSRITTLDAQEQARRDAGVKVRDRDGSLPVSLGLRRAVKGQDLQHPEFYRIAGPRYLPLEGDLIGDMLADSLHKQFRGRVDYDGEKWTMECLAVDPSDAPGMVGETFSVGLLVKGDDVRKGRLDMHGFAMRWRCLNGTILNSKRNLFSRKHVGNLSFEEITAMIGGAIKQVEKDFGVFLNRWSEAAKEQIFASDRTPQQIFGALVDAGLVDLPGGFDEVTARLVSAWEKEPGYSRTDICNAITRAAHTTDWWNDIDASREAEAQAGALLYVRNLPQQIDAAISKRASMIELN